MKAIIVERRGDYAAVLCEDGTFLKTRSAGEVGETVELAAKRAAFPSKARGRWMRSAVAAVLALTITGGTLGYMGGTASAYVSLDVDDSSIELAVNHFGRVISVSALSDDASEFAERLAGEVRHHRAEDALAHTMNRLREEGYLADRDIALVAGVTSDNANRAAELKRSVESAAGDGQTLYVSEGSRREREHAMEGHCSAGRFLFERDHPEDAARERRNAEARREPPPSEPPHDEPPDARGARPTERGGTSKT